MPFTLTGLPAPAELVAALPRALPSLMLFSICWSLGASCDKAGRALVDKLIRSRVSDLGQSQQALQQLPAVMRDSATVYDWCYDHKVRHLERLLLKLGCLSLQWQGHVRHRPVLNSSRHRMSCQ